MNSEHPTYTPTEWLARQRFTRLINDICAKNALDITWFSDAWIARISKNDVHRFISGNTFPLNNAVSASLMRDKAAASVLLAAHSIPVVPHQLLWLPRMREITHAAARAQTLFPLPMVIKPNAESSGFDVYKCTTTDEVKTATRALSKRHRAIAVSPFIEIKREFRIIMCEDSPLLIFSKQRQANEWRHNLARGATPAIVTDDTLRTHLTRLASQSMRALDAQLGAVDIVETSTGYMIIEINGGFVLDHFCQHSPEYKKLAEQVYETIIKKMMLPVNTTSH